MCCRLVAFVQYCLFWVIRWFDIYDDSCFLLFWATPGVVWTDIYLFISSWYYVIYRLTVTLNNFIWLTSVFMFRDGDELDDFCSFKVFFSVAIIYGYPSPLCLILPIKRLTFVSPQNTDRQKVLVQFVCSYFFLHCSLILFSNMIVHFGILLL